MCGPVWRLVFILYNIFMYSLQIMFLLKLLAIPWEQTAYLMLQSFFYTYAKLFMTTFKGTNEKTLFKISIILLILLAFVILSLKIIKTPSIFRNWLWKELNLLIKKILFLDLKVRIMHDKIHTTYDKDFCFEVANFQYLYVEVPKASIIWNIHFTVLPLLKSF